MKIDIPGIRPAVIDRELEEILDELRRFRHLFGNLYKSRLKPHRVPEVSELVDSIEECYADRVVRSDPKLIFKL